MSTLKFAARCNLAEVVWVCGGWGGGRGWAGGGGVGVGGVWGVGWEWDPPHPRRDGVGWGGLGWGWGGACLVCGVEGDWGAT